MRNEDERTHLLLSFRKEGENALGIFAVRRRPPCFSISIDNESFHGSPCCYEFLNLHFQIFCVDLSNSQVAPPNSPMRRLASSSTSPAAAAKTCVVVCYSSLRSFYSGISEKRLKQLKMCNFHVNKPRGRCSYSMEFERRISLVGIPEGDGLASMYSNLTPNTVVVEPVTAPQLEEPVPHPSYIPAFTENGVYSWSKDIRKNIRKNGDACLTTYNVSTSPSVEQQHSGDGDAKTAAQVATTSASMKNHIITVMDPDLTHRMYRLEEASIEMITAFRNILFEFWDLKTARLLRIPALSIYTHRPQLEEDIPKINQVSIIKGFHRCPNALKEWWFINKDLRIELFVPMKLLPTYQRTFLEEAWGTPESIWIPNRTTLYPGIDVPELLLENPGFHGHRPEILDSVKTGGLSLEGGPKMLDGSPAEKADAIAGAQTAAARHQSSNVRKLEKIRKARDEKMRRLATEQAEAQRAADEANGGEEKRAE